MNPVSQKFFPTVAALFFACFMSGAFSAVLQYPRSKVALLGDSVSFTCKGQGDGTLLVDNLNPVGDNNVNQKLLADNITWSKQEHGVGNSKETTFTVSAVATASNNGTFIWCGFEYHGSTSSTDDVFLIVVTGPPEPPRNFELQTTNMTALSLTWTAPLPPHLINNYTVSMLNLTSSKVTQWTTTDTRFMVTRGKEDNCHRLQFIVTAMTDVGSSNTPTIEKGFPKGMTNLNQNSVYVETLQRANGTLKIEPKFEIPERCSYERHLYSFAIKNLSTEAVVGNINTTIPHMVFGGGIEPGTDYQLVIGVHNEAGMSVSAEKNFNSGFNKKQTCITTTPPPQLPPVTVQAPEVSDSQSLVLASSGALGAVILLLVMLLFVLLGLLIHSRRTVRTKRQTVCANDEVTIGQEHANSTSTTAEKPKNLPIPRTMATNPMYEASTPIYDFVPEGKDLRNLSPDASCQQANHSSLPVDIPPQLPVRKPTLDSPQGVKSTAQLVLDKMAPPVSPGVNEEYMYMKAIDPRYSRPPASLERIKKEELILSPTENKKE